MTDKDILGNEVLKGDLMIQISGWGSTFTYKLYEFVDSKDTKGVYYEIDGSKHNVWHFHPSKSIKVDLSKVPDNVLFAFMHGVNSIESEIESIDVRAIFEKSNWKGITKKEIEDYEKLKSLKLNSISDIANNLEILVSGYIPTEVIERVINLAGIDQCKPKNGEIGIASYSNYIKYIKIIKYIDSSLSKAS